MAAAGVFTFWAEVPQPAAAAESAPQDDLFIPESQDQALMRKAWEADVTVQCRNRPFADVLAGWSKQSGIPIEVDEAAVAGVLSGKEEDFAILGPELTNMTSSWGGYLGMPAGRARARAFLGLRAATQLAVRVVEYDPVMINLPTVRLFTCRDKLPLAMAVEYLAASRNLDVSYRKGRIVVSSPGALAEELLVTRTFKITYGVVRFSYKEAAGISPRPLAERTGAMNVAEYLLAYMRMAPAEKAWGGTDPENADHLKVLRDLRPATRIEHDPATGTLTITAPSLAVELFARWGRDLIDRPDRRQFDELTAAGRMRRLEQLATAAWAALDEPARAKLLAARAALDDPDEKSRQAAERQLIAAGPAAAKPLLDAEPAAAAAEEPPRFDKLLRQIHFRHELPLIRRQIEAYVKAAAAGKLDELRRDFWDRARNAAFDRTAAEFATDVAAAGDDKSTLQYILDKYHLRKRPRPLTWDAAQIQGMQVRNVTIEEIALRGGAAEVLLAVELRPEHPDKNVLPVLSRLPVTVSVLLEDGQWKVTTERTWLPGKDVMRGRAKVPANYNAQQPQDVRQLENVLVPGRPGDQAVEGDQGSAGHGGGGLTAFHIPL